MFQEDKANTLNLKAIVIKVVYMHVYSPWWYNAIFLLVCVCVCISKLCNSTAVHKQITGTAAEIENRKLLIYVMKISTHCHDKSIFKLSKEQTAK